MTGWEINSTDKYERDYKHYEKKHSDELIAVLSNLEFYWNALSELGNPLLINAGYIHPEPHGVIAIDQRGGKRRVTLQETRLYIYPDVKGKILYLLTIGDKNSQKTDIKFCIDTVKQIKKENP